MYVLLRLPALPALLVLAAHFFRAAMTAPPGPWLRAILLMPVAACLLACILLWLSSPAARRTVMALLLLGSAEWVRVIIDRVQYRLATEQPWQRLALILGGVALWTLASALLLWLEGRRARASSPSPPGRGLG